MNLSLLVLKYVLFSLFAIFANLATQRIILSLGSEVKHYWLALMVGTLIGLLIKFFLDKYWIFGEYSSDLYLNTKFFFWYSLMGLLTTLFFWVVETSFWIIWKTEFMRELGAVIGLSVGYFIKYFLDRNFVFTFDEKGAKA